MTTVHRQIRRHVGEPNYYSRTDTTCRTNISSPR